MRLYLLRHAQAKSDEPDPDRVLTRRGRRDAEKLGRLMESRPGFKPRAIWHSPYIRAEQTARIVAEESGFSGPLIAREGLLPCDSPHAMIRILQEIDQSVLIVGHNPHLALLAGRLLGTTAYSVSIEFKKCGLLCMERHRPLDAPLPPLWSLRWMLVPQLLR